LTVAWENQAKVPLSAKAMAAAVAAHRFTQIRRRRR